MNATVERESQEDQLPVTIVHTWGGWPWRAECRVCETCSPGQRTRDEAREWGDSHLHAFHEI
ncbi:hypothetical protein GCM10009839_90800 [Catenulispora yoronensis]|uniref:Uncharacterized protein n=1 Tax=Catenulispora yoronensis TaxID=450799 RepID=A0ABP5HBJ1_9ACTN